MELFKDLISIIDNVAGIVIKPVKVITKEIVNKVEETAKDIFGD